MSKPLNQYDPTNYVETGLIRSKSLTPGGAANWDKIFGVKKRVQYVPPPLPEYTVACACCGKQTPTVEGLDAICPECLE